MFLLAQGTENTNSEGMINMLFPMSTSIPIEFKSTLEEKNWKLNKSLKSDHILSNTADPLHSGKIVLLALWQL